MSELKKAVLQEIHGVGPDAKFGPPVHVQFNPATLKLQRATAIDANKTKGRQARQYLGSSSTTLSLELLFDTADEGTTAAPRSVLTRTADVERFMIPSEHVGENQVAPRVRFAWGDLIVDGIMDALSIDLDHFAADGTPLRAKLGVTIKEQDAKIETLQRGAGANRAAEAPRPGQVASGAVGTVGPAPEQAERIGRALPGESAADFATRTGLDPAAWRGLSLGGANPASLPGGLVIGYGAAQGGALGGATPGVNADASQPLVARLGLDSAPTNRSASVPRDPTAAGLALATAGGVAAALATARNARAEATRAGQKQAFGLPTADATRPLSAEDGPATVDPRVASFGAGVPLRTTVGAAAAQWTRRAQGGGPPAAAPLDGPPRTFDPTIPSWRALPMSGTTAPLVARASGCRCGGRNSGDCRCGDTTS